MNHNIFLQILLITFAHAFLISMSSMQFSKPTLIDAPLSPFGSRVRFVIYEKKLESEIDIVSPAVFGGMKTEEYKAINPVQKIPGFVDGDLKFGESDTIVRYLLDKYGDRGPSFVGKTLAERTLTNVICRHLDMYIAPLNSSFYKADLPFGPHRRRGDGLEDMKKQLKVLESMLSEKGPYMTGETLTLADISCLGPFVFLNFMCPKFDWKKDDIMGPKLQAWWNHISKHETGAKIIAEIESPLKQWDESGRWNTILFAGWRDTAPETVFDKIIRKEIPSTTVYEDNHVLAFKDINPVAPVHIVIIPKFRDGMTRLSAAKDENSGVIGKMMVAASKIAAEQKLEGFRVVVNDGHDGGQEVYHLHMHLIGGRKLSTAMG